MLEQARPVEICSVDGVVYGKALVTFTRDEGEPTIHVVETTPESHMKECFFVIKMGEGDDMGVPPEKIYAFQLGDYISVGEEPFLHVFHHYAQGK